MPEQLKGFSRSQARRDRLARALSLLPHQVLYLDQQVPNMAEQVQMLRVMKRSRALHASRRFAQRMPTRH